MARGCTYKLIISGPKTSRTYELAVGTTIIGRNPDSDLRLVHSLVSRQHARLDCTPMACRITDLGSMNGSYVNGARVPPDTPAQLAHNAVVRIGPFKLTLTVQSCWLADYLPGIYQRDSLQELYHTDFLDRFLALFESILIPIEWNVDNFDLYLDPRTAPADFFPWLASWFDVTFDPTWSESQRRQLLAEAGKIYARRGTARALRQVLGIYTGCEPREIEIDDGQDQAPFSFTVKLPLRESDTDQMFREGLEVLIDAHKPVHTTCELEFAGQGTLKNGRIDQQNPGPL